MGWFAPKLSELEGSPLSVRQDCLPVDISETREGEVRVIG